MNQSELRNIREAYARQILAIAGVSDPRVEAAFAEVPREDYLGPGPWPIFRGMGSYVPTPSADPAHVYTNDLIGIIPDRHINNGQPSLHAHLIASAIPQAGDHVVHVGTGAGYYTAILAYLAGAAGKVTAVEYDGELAVRARANLSRFPTVSLVHGDGATVHFDTADVIYVNAGATRPASSWLDRLADGGRLILPLTTHEAFGPLDDTKIRKRGAVFRIERRGDEFLASWISPVAIFPCVGARDDTSEAALAGAFEDDGWQRVTRLHRGDAMPTEGCWVRGSDWCLAYE